MSLLSILQAVVRSRAGQTFRAWMAAYPTALTVVWLLGPHLAHLPLPLRLLPTTALIVTIVANVTQPALRRAIDRIVFPPNPDGAGDQE